CYVGLTRAREKLYLSWASTRYRNGRLELSEPSRFLEALPPGALEERSTTPTWDRGARASRRGGARARGAAPADLDWDVEVSQDAPRYTAGERRREAVRARAGRAALPGRRSTAHPPRVWSRDAGARLQGRLLPGAEARRVRGRRLVSDPSEALASAKAAADRLVKAKRLNACLTPTAPLRKSLLTQAQAAHPSGVLYGMPVAVKDNICTLEFTTTCGSKILEAYRSPYEATAVAKLKAAGALIAGKTNCDEFAMGSSTEHSAYGRTLH